MEYCRLASMAEIQRTTCQCRAKTAEVQKLQFDADSWENIWQVLAFLTILSTEAEQLCTQWWMLPSSPADCLANTRHKSTEMEMCKPQNKNANLSNEGWNLIFTLSLDPPKKPRLSCLLLHLYSLRKLLLVFSCFNNGSRTGVSAHVRIKKF